MRLYLSNFQLSPLHNFQTGNWRICFRYHREENPTANRNLPHNRQKPNKKMSLKRRLGLCVLSPLLLPALHQIHPDRFAPQHELLDRPFGQNTISLFFLDIFSMD